jgi:hypothetical protein
MSADRPTIADVADSNVSSMSTNFNASRIAIGYSTASTNTGTVRIYDYTVATNTWDNAKIIDGPCTGAFFGQSIDMDWDGDCLVVGANAISTVYVYNYDGAAWQLYSNTITCPSGTGAEFGWAVSLAKDTSDALAIGSPAHNNVFVYELTNSAWVESFQHKGDDLDNVVTSNLNSDGTRDHIYIVIPSLNNYGYSVRLSSFGDNLVVGQPGTILTELNSTNLLYSNGNQFSSTADPINLISSTQTDFKDQMRQDGSARIFKTNNKWLTSNLQVGSNLIPTINCTLDNKPGDVNQGWSFPGFGMSCDISTDGNLVVVAAPLHSVLGIDRTFFHGQLYTYTLNSQNEWEQKNVLTGLKNIKLGLSMKLDYTGFRIALGGASKLNSYLSMCDWNGTNWFNVVPDIVIGKTDGNKRFFEVAYTSDGKTGFISANNYSVPYTYSLTQTVLGNTLSSGYLAANQLYVGNNGNDTIVSDVTSSSRKISFGGTYADNTYEGATIENRLYEDVGGYGQASEGRSEIFIAKTSKQVGASESGGVDFVRLKANEIHLDSYQLYDGDKYEMSPLLVLNYQKNVSIGLPYNTNLGGGSFYRGTSDTKAKLDVNGEVYIRNRLNINVDDANDLRGVISSEPDIFFDTRNASTINVAAGELFSNVLRDNKQFDKIGYLLGNALYDVTERAVDLSSGGYINIYGDGVKPDTQRAKIGFWLKLKSLLGSGTVQLCKYGSDDDNPTPAAGKQYVTVSITPTSFIVDYQYIRVETFAFTFEVDKWYHIYQRFPGHRATIGNYGDPQFRVNDVPLASTGNNGVSAPSTYYFDTNIKLVLGPINGTSLPGYVGMIMLWSAYESDRSTASVSAMYRNGSPTEMLKVGGDVTVTKNLDVFGNAYVTGSTTSGNAVITRWPYHNDMFAIYNSNLNGLSNYALIQTNTGRTTINSDYQRLAFSYGGVTKMCVAANGYVGIGTTSPTNGKLHVVGAGNSVALGQYGYLNSGGTGVASPNSITYGIYSDGRIACVEFNAFSDVRIKKEIEDVIDSSALETFRLLKPKTYKYIDEKSRGSDTVYGFIAQEVLDVLPYAVTASLGDIPNILINSNVVLTGTSIELHLDTSTDVNLSNTSILNITTSDDNRIRSNVQSIDSTGTIITVDYSDELSNVYGAYIHGESIDDFHHLNKDSVWTLATAALQEVDRLLQEEKTKVAALESQLVSVLDRLDALENN